MLRNISITRKITTSVPKAFSTNSAKLQTEQPTEEPKKKTIRFRGSVNRATLIGYAGNDAITRNSSSGNPITTFSLATSDTYAKRGSDGKTPATWHNITILNEKASAFAQKFIKKGVMVFVEGPITYRKVEKEGAQVSSYVQIVVRDPSDIRVLAGEVERVEEPVAAEESQDKQ